jgi:hypothetical protein
LTLTRQARATQIHRHLTSFAKLLRQKILRNAKPITALWHNPVRNRSIGAFRYCSCFFKNCTWVTHFLSLEKAMYSEKIELYCERCDCGFTAPPETSAQKILELMTEEGPWYGLGEGETFEDMIFAALTERGAIYCPVCGEQVAVSEESLGKMAMEMLAGW